MTTQQQKQPRVYINFFNEITPQSVNNLMGVCTQLLRETPDELYFLFSSPGGHVDSGITLYNYLKAIAPKIIMHNTGAINSIATVVFLAGDERYAANHSTFLFHGVKTGFSKDSQMTLAQIREIESQLKEDEKKISGIVAGQTELTDDDIAKLFAQGESKGLEFAIDKGIVSEVRDPQISSGAPIVNMGL